MRGWQGIRASMILLVDGYNVLKSQLASKYADEHDRHRFIQQLIKFANRKNNRLIIVFDGGSHPWDLSEPYGEHDVMYSGYKQTADVVLRKLIARYRGYDVMVISSDREVVRYAKHHGLTPLSAQEFIGMLQQVVSIPSPVVKGTQEPVKITDEKNAELDILMEESSRKMPVKREQQELRERTSAVSKREAQLERQKKKL